MTVLSAALAMAASTPLAAEAKVKSTRYAKAGNWTINSVIGSNGAFNHCSARAVYRSGMEVFLIAYNSGAWSIQFYRKDWPNRKDTKFPATLLVDGREIMRTQGRFRGRSAFLDLGRSARNRRAIMRGNIMTVRSASGESRYKLTGTNRAAGVVARCLQRYQGTIVANRNEGAFGGGARQGNPGGNEGAFGGGNTNKAAPRRNPAIVSRAQTLEFAARYLSKAKMRYEILQKEKNVFRYFPVNWRYADGRIGGMLVMQTRKLNAETGLTSLLRDQAKWCKGRSATDRRPLTGQPGRRLARARGICEANGRVTEVEYSVAELGNNRIMLIAEGLNASRPGAAAPKKGAPLNLPLPPSAREPQQPASRPQQRRPSPNEL
ncbi:MAG: hypothetical protein AAFQ45_15115 [Pseudomonadota bacterium]